MESEVILIYDREKPHNLKKILLSSEKGCIELTDFSRVIEVETVLTDGMGETRKVVNLELLCDKVETTYE